MTSHLLVLLVSCIFDFVVCFFILIFTYLYTPCILHIFCNSHCRRVTPPRHNYCHHFYLHFKTHKVTDAVLLLPCVKLLCLSLYTQQPCGHETCICLLLTSHLCPGLFLSDAGSLTLQLLRAARCLLFRLMTFRRNQDFYTDGGWRQHRAQRQTVLSLYRVLDTEAAQKKHFSCCLHSLMIL